MGGGRRRGRGKVLLLLMMMMLMPMAMMMLMMMVAKMMIGMGGDVDTGDDDDDGGDDAVTATPKSAATAAATATAAAGAATGSGNDRKGGSKKKNAAASKSPPRSMPLGQGVPWWAHFQGGTKPWIMDNPHPDICPGEKFHKQAEWFWREFWPTVAALEGGVLTQQCPSFARARPKSILSLGTASECCAARARCPFYLPQISLRESYVNH